MAFSSHWRWKWKQPSVDKPFCRSTASCAQDKKLSNGYDPTANVMKVCIMHNKYVIHIGRDMRGSLIFLPKLKYKKTLQIGTF